MPTEKAIRYKEGVNSDKQKFIRFWFKSARAESKCRNISWDISFEDFHKKVNLLRKCQVSKIPLVFKTGTRYNRNMYRPSIDRIDSDKGYSLNNIQIVAAMVNFAKQTMTQEEFVSMCGAVYKNAKKRYNGRID